MTKHTAVDESERAGEHGTEDSMQSSLDVSKLPQGQSSVRVFIRDEARRFRGD